MRHVPLALLPALGIALTACGDAHRPLTQPSQRSNSDASVRPTAKLDDSLQVIYTTFGPGMAFDAAANPYQISGSRLLGSPTPAYAASMRFFSPPGEYTFERATLAVGSHPGMGPADFRVLLQADSTPSVHYPGRVLEEWSISIPSGTAPATYTVTSALRPVLTDSMYWLTVRPGNDSMRGWWYRTNSMLVGEFDEILWRKAAFLNLIPPQNWLVDFYAGQSSFQIEGRPRHGKLVHSASGGGTPDPENGYAPWQHLPYTVSAREHQDGTVDGQLLTGGTPMGAVTCLTVSGNTAYISGALTGSFLVPDTRTNFMLVLRESGSKGSGTITQVIPLSAPRRCPSHIELDELILSRTSPGTADVK